MIAPVEGFKNAESKLANAASHRASSGSLIKEGGILSRLSGMVGMASTVVMFAPMIGGALGKMSKWSFLKPVSKPLDFVGKTSELANATLGELPQKVAGTFGESHLLTGATKSLHGSVSQFANKTLSGGIRERLSNVSVTNALFAGTMITGEAASTVMTFKNRIQTLKQMQKDLTGKTPSTMQVLMGRNLDPLVMRARREATGMKAFAATSLQVGGMLGNVYLMLFPSKNNDPASPFKNMVAPMLKFAAVGMGTSMAANAITSGDTALNSYRNMALSIRQNGRASLDDYVGVIGGFSKGASDQKVRVFAKQCFDENLAPAEVLRRVTVFEKASKGVAAGGRAGALPAPIGAATAREAARRAASLQGAGRGAFAAT